jgi:hypothetical protein
LETGRVGGTLVDTGVRGGATARVVVGVITGGKVGSACCVFFAATVNATAVEIDGSCVTDSPQAESTSASTAIPLRRIKFSFLSILFPFVCLQILY